MLYLIYTDEKNEHTPDNFLGNWSIRNVHVIVLPTFMKVLARFLSKLRSSSALALSLRDTTD